MKFTKTTMTHDLDAERSILREILIRNSVLSTVKKLELNADDFFDGDHRIIFQAYCKLSENKSPINMETVITLLRSQHHHGVVNPSNSLTSLFTSGFSIGDVSSYVQILKSHANLRQLLKPAQIKDDR